MVVALLVLIGSPNPAGAAQLTPRAGCALETVQREWIQRALDSWHRISVGDLRLKGAPLPWMLLFDASCVWHLAPGDTVPVDAELLNSGLTFDEGSGRRAVIVRARRHDGRLTLPDGKQIPAEPLASAGVYRAGAASYFVMALPDVWRRDPRHASMAEPERFFHGVMTHELVHTRHLPQILEPITAVARRFPQAPPQIDDDVIQTRFQDVPGFGAAIAAETDQFYEAVAAKDANTRRALVARALAKVRERHIQFFVGADLPFADLEDLFLAMEGAGQWAAYRATKARAGSNTTDAEAIEFVRDHKYWSQEQGLALFLLLDAMIPDWPARVLGAEAATPLALLREALVPDAVVRELVAAFNAHNVAQMLRLCAPDIRWMSVASERLTIEALGTESLGKAMESYFRTVPSARSTLLSTVVSGNFVTAVEQATWHSGGQQRVQCSVSLYEVRGQKIQSVWYFPAHTCD